MKILFRLYLLLDNSFRDQKTNENYILTCMAAVFALTISLQLAWQWLSRNLSFSEYLKIGNIIIKNPILYRDWIKEQILFVLLILIIDIWTTNAHCAEEESFLS